MCLLYRMLAVQQKIRQCQEEGECKTLVKANKGFEEKVKKKVMKVIDDLRNNKIDHAEFKERLRAIKDEGLHSKQNIDLIKCSIKHCNEQLKEMMKNNVCMLEKVCKLAGDKGACAKVKEIKKLSKTLSFENYMKIIEVLNKLSMT